MGLFARLREERATKAIGGHPSGGSWIDGWFGGSCDVNEQTAMQLATVWACVRAISEDVSKLPLKVYRWKSDDEREKVRGHPVSKLLNRRANSYATPSMIVRETLLARALLWGNGYAEIERDNTGRPIGLWPLDNVKVTPTVENGQLRYRYRGDSGEINVPGDDMFHVRGLGGDGVCGWSVVRFARESMTLSRSAETFGSSFFRNGLRPSGVLKHPGKLTDKAKINLRESLQKLFGGAQNVAKLLVIEEGMAFEKLTIDPNDAQFLETRQFQIPEICRWFRMKPHKVADLSRATFSNIEHQDLEYVGDTLMGWMVRVEQEADLKLFTPAEQQGEFYAEHLVAGLLRGDLKSRYDAYAQGRQWGWLSADEVRAKEGENPIPEGNGKLYLVPINMTTADKVGQQPAAKPSDPAAPTPAVRLLVTERAKETRRRRRGDVVNAVVEAHRPLLEEAVRRCLKTEADKVRRASNRGELATWSKQYYAELAPHVRAGLQPVLVSLAQTVRALDCMPGDGLSPELVQFADGMSQRHVERSLAELAASTSLDVTLAKWEESRSSEFAAGECKELAKLLGAKPCQRSSSAA